MNRWTRNQDVTVTYKGIEHRAEILDPTVRHGTILARLHRDPELDYGRPTDALGLEFIVCINENQVRPT